MSLIESKTFWSSAIGLLFFVLTILGYNTKGIDQNHLALELSTIVAGVGYVGAVIGRIVASKKIISALPQPPPKKDVEL